MRKLTAGDYGASLPNATHTFQIVESNTEMYGVIFDGGLEKMFFAIGLPNLTYSSFSPYDPNAIETMARPATGYNGSYDIIANPDFVPRRDIVNGSAWRSCCIAMLLSCREIPPIATMRRRRCRSRRSYILLPRSTGLTLGSLRGECLGTRRCGRRLRHNKFERSGRETSSLDRTTRTFISD